MTAPTIRVKIRPLDNCIWVSASTDSLVSHEDTVKYVYPPNWLFRLLGDSIEQRIERAKRTVIARAEHHLARQQYLEAVARKAALA